MTAGTTIRPAEAPVSVGAVRSYIGRRHRRSWLDWYVAGFALVIAGIYGSDILASPLHRLSGQGTQAAATHAAALQAVTGAGLVIGAGAGLLLLAQALGPLMLSPADSSWLLLTPLNRRGILRRPALSAAVGAALAGALAAQGSTALVRAVTDAFGRLTTPDFTIAALSGVALACVCWLLLWRALPVFPAATLRTDSARSGRALLAAGFLNFSLLFWIAEDNHWRGRLLRSRSWPRLPPAAVLAWADWRRIGRRPGPLAVIAIVSVFPALLGAAFTGRAHGILIAAGLVVGAMAAGLQGTTGARRDLDSGAMRRLLGVAPGQVLLARSTLPALLATAWLVLALTVLPAVGALNGWWWPLLALAGPGVAAGVLRLARTAPVNPSDRGPDLPMGSTPPWMISRLFSVAVVVAGSLPLLAAVINGHASAGTAVAQFLVSAVVLGFYLLIAAGSGR